MAKTCGECGQTKWEGRQVENYLDSLRDDLEAVESERDRLLVHAAAALERVQVGDCGEAEMILEGIVQLDGSYIPERAA